MEPERDKKQKYPEKQTFQEKWLLKFSWLKRGKDIHHGFCTACGKDITVAHMGKGALIQHQKKKKHTDNMQEFVHVEERGTKLADVYTKKSEVPISVYKRNPQCSFVSSVPSNYITNPSQPCSSNDHKKSSHFENKKFQSNESPLKNCNTSVLKDMNNIENVPHEHMLDDGYPVTARSSAGKVTFDQQKENLSYKNLLQRKNSTENDFNPKITNVCSLNPEAVMDDEDSVEEMRKDDFHPDISSKRIISYSENDKLNQGNLINGGKSETYKHSQASSSSKVTTVHTNKDKSKKKSHANPDISPKRITSDPKCEKLNESNLMLREKSEKNSQASSSAKQPTVPSSQNKSKKKPENEKKKSHENPDIPKKITCDPKYEKLNQDNPTLREKSEKNKNSQASTSAKQTTVHSSEDKSEKKPENERKKSHENPDIPKKITSDPKYEKLNKDNPMLREKSEKNKNSQASEKNKNSQASSSAKQTTVHSSEDKSKKKPENEKKKSHENPKIPKKITSDPKYDKLNQGNPMLREKSDKNSQASSPAKQTTVHSSEEKSKKKPEDEKKKSHENPDVPKKITFDPKYEKLNQDNPMLREKSEKNKTSQASSSAKQTTVHSSKDKSKKKPQNKKKSHENPDSPKKITSDPKYEKLNQDNPMLREKSEKNKNSQASSSVKQTAVHSSENKSKKKPDNEKNKSHENPYIPKKMTSDTKHEKLNQDNPTPRKESETNKYSEASTSAKEMTVLSNEDKSPKQPENESKTHAYSNTSKRVKLNRKNEESPSDYSVIAYKLRKIIQITKETDNEISKKDDLSEQDAIIIKLPENRDYLKHLLSLDKCFLASTQSMKNSLSLKKNFVKIQKPNGKTKFIQKVKNKCAILRKKSLAKASRLSRSSQDKKPSIEKVESRVSSCSTVPDHIPNTAGRNLSNADFHVATKKHDRLLQTKKWVECRDILIEVVNFLGQCDTSKFDFIDSIYDNNLPSGNRCNKEAIKLILTLCDNDPDFSKAINFSNGERISRVKRRHETKKEEISNKKKKKE